MALELLLFTNRPNLARRAQLGGAGGILIDWERRGKLERQAGADTSISSDTPNDLQRIRKVASVPLICRLDSVGPWTREQLELAIRLGADEVLVPMVRRSDEVELVLGLAAGRCGVGILVETMAALANGTALATLPLSRVYVGLNDLSIERRTPSIFTALADGTIDQLRDTYSEHRFGFGGATVPDGGRPIPARMMLGELARAGADYTFLRRSFWRDTRRIDVASAVTSITLAAHVAFARSGAAVARDRQEFLRTVDRLGATAASASAPAAAA